MVGSYEDRGDARVHHGRSRCPVGVVYVPKGDQGVRVGGVRGGIRTRRRRRIALQVILEYAAAGLVVPEFKATTTTVVLPEIGDQVGQVRARIVAHLSQLARHLLRVDVRRWPRTELAATGQRPRLPRAGQRLDRIGSLPFAGFGRYAAAPHGIRSVTLTPRDRSIPHLAPERQSGDDITRIGNSSLHTRVGRLVGPG